MTTERAVEAAVERKVEEAMSGVKARLLEQFFQREAREHLSSLSARVEQQFAQLSMRVEQQLLLRPTPIPQEEPPFSYSESKHGLSGFSGGPHAENIP